MLYGSSLKTKIPRLRDKERSMHPLVGPIMSIVAGVIVLVYPRILNYVVAVYLILFGILEIIHKN